MDLNGLQDRLLSRFQSGLIVDIQPPDLETRIAILRLKAEQDNLEIPYEIIEFIAENICSNVRELEGAMIRLLAYSSLLNVDIDIELAKKVLREIQGSKRQSIISVENIQNVICSSYNINLDLLIGKNRRKEIAEARMIAMYFTREYTNLSLKTIGLYFGGRDHSTVVHACKWVESKIDSDLKFSDNISSLKSRIESTV
jgi:chromosomal replication initiator protein